MFYFHSGLDHKEILLPLHFRTLCVLFSLFCVAHSASFLCAPRHVLMSEAFRGDLVWCIVLLLRQKHIILKLESAVCAPWREEEKRNNKPSTSCGGLFKSHFKFYITYKWIHWNRFFICLCILFPCQMIWSYVTTLCNFIKLHIVRKSHSGCNVDVNLFR